MAGPKKSPKPASPRQRRYVKARIDGESMAEAARQAGYAESTSLKAASKVEAKPAVQKLFAQLMEEAGISDKKLARRLNELLDAKETKFFQKDGKVKSTRTVVDYGSRHRGLDLALKLKGHLIDKHEILGDGGGPLTIRVEYAGAEKGGDDA